MVWKKVIADNYWHYWVPKWEQKSVAASSGKIVTWVDVLSFERMCFGCNVSALKHAPFCHNSQSYCRREASHYDPKLIGNVLPFLTCEDLLSLSVDEAKFDKKITLSKKIYKEQIKEHNEVVQVDTGQICHATTVAAANLLSLKQVDNILENVKTVGCHDSYNSNDKDKDISIGNDVGIGEQMHFSKKKYSTSASKKSVSRNKLPIVVRKSLRNKSQQRLFWM